ncbi:PREDICTED: uncharacterized protein LOC104807982 [Tarenaya hassleriana]|uniref:uncharacterized protein LOC104807982 n=1 Tax=Tarenaya hassleriana TaxID=28532 RepID=UPI00053C5F4F|nr:PREDICTED: uncharacterized protein LOC104807982 [Tarenaya hassleriana]
MKALEFVEITRPRARGHRARVRVDDDESDHEEIPRRRVNPRPRDRPRRWADDVEEEEELRPRQPRGPSNDLKLKPPLFVGKVDPEAHLDWERCMDNIFECYAYSDRRRVQYAAAQLAENALAWWDRETTERRRAHIEQVGTWREMKVLMRKRYVPPHFHRELQRKYRKLAQGARPVE